MLTTLEASWTGSDGYFDLGTATLSDSSGEAIDFDLGSAFVIGNPPEGCTDSEADNYDPNAVFDDGSCVYSGCTDPNAQNYDPNLSLIHI